MSKSRPRQNNGAIPQDKVEPTACRRCGVCCTRHQAFVSPEDILRITDYLGITMADWDRLYDDSRWQYSDYRLIRHINGGCAFLRYEKGLAACTIHTVKPVCCANWKPGPDRPECREGMTDSTRAYTAGREYWPG